MKAMDHSSKRLAAIGLFVLVVGGAAFFAYARAGHSLDVQAIANASGAKATEKNGVVRIEFPRTDVAVKVDGMPLKPAAGLGCWAAFTATPRGAMVMGDTVVFQDEVTQAMDAAFANDLEVTALHNHFFFDE